MKLKNIYIAIIFLSFNLISNVAHSKTAHETAEDIHTQVIEVIQENKSLYSSNKEMFIEKIELTMKPAVDFKRISRNVMGKYYKQATEEQRNLFLEVFKITLLKTYSDTFFEFKDEEIRVLPEKEKPKRPNRVKVGVEIITDTKVYPATYDMYKNKKEEWKIINIVVNGVNLGLTFRNQFYSLTTKRKENIDLVIEEWVASL